MKTLVVPSAVQRDNDAVQMLSAWIAEKGLHCSINIGHWEGGDTPEATAWGILLADAIRHISSAMLRRYGISQTDTVSKIIRALQAELNEPTSDVAGEFSHGHN